MQRIKFKPAGKTTPAWIAASVLSVLALPAQAQSSVTLYGILDDGFGYVSNVGGGRAFQQESGDGSATERWGLRGIEDLGGGLGAVFVLENSFASNNGRIGTAGREFGRQAYVGLSQKGLGTITLGRQYDPLADLVAGYAGPGFWNVSAHVGDNDNLNQFFRLNNAVKIASATWHGLTAEALYAFSNQASTSDGQGFANNRAWALAANYVNGPFSIGGGFFEIDNPNSTTNTSGAVGGASTTNGDDYSSTFFYGIDGGVLRQRIAAGGTKYTYGLATGGFEYSHSALDYADGSSRKFNNFDVNLRYQLTPAVLVLGAYTYTDGTATNLPGASSNDLKPKWHQLTLAGTYSLSRRTSLYLTGVYQKSVGDGTTLVNGTYQNIASIAYAGSSSSNSQLAVYAGITHSF